MYSDLGRLTDVDTPRFKTIGVSHNHESAALHVTGDAVYVDDREEVGSLLHLAVGKSNCAHARVRSMDLSNVGAAEGVVTVLTAGDIPGVNEVGNVAPGDPLFVDDVVQFFGQAMFVVAAESHRLAQRAAMLAEIEYEALGVVLDPDVASAKGLFVCSQHVQERGSPDDMLAHSPQRLEGTVQLGGQEHFYLEGQVALAVPIEDGCFEVHVSSQNPSENQRIIAEVLAVPRNKVLVETRRMGGGFGGKESQAGPWACMVALVAQRTGRPAKLRLSRIDDMVLTGKRHPFSSHYCVGFTDDGTIGGLEIMFNVDAGFSPDLTGSVIDRALFDACNAYYIPNVRVSGNACKTNKVSNTAFRGFGSPQSIATIEAIIDGVAYTLEKDPLDIRLANLMGKQEKNITHFGQQVENNRIREVVDRLEAESQYRARRAQIDELNRTDQVLKGGIALTPLNFGVGFTVPFLNQAGALVHVYPDGSVHLNQGGTEMGQGLFTKVAQVVAEEFQIDIGAIQVSSTRVDKVPNTSPTAASFGSDLNGMAALDAAQTIRARLVDFAAKRYGVAPSEVEFADSYVRMGDETVVPFEELVQQAHLDKVQLSAAGFCGLPDNPYDRETGRGRPYFYFVQGAAVTEVVVDTLTGEYRLVRVDLLHSVGQSLNPAIDMGQIEGGFMQGVGWLTCEELVWSDSGELLTRGPATYKIPGVSDCPGEFNIHMLEPDGEETLLFRSKAVGEPPLVLAVSVLSALRHAVAGSTRGPVVPELDGPATPERVLAAVGRVRQAAQLRQDAADDERAGRS